MDRQRNRIERTTNHSMTVIFKDPLVSSTLRMKLPECIITRTNLFSNYITNKEVSFRVQILIQFTFALKIHV